MTDPTTWPLASLPRTILDLAELIEMDLSPGQTAELRLKYGLPITDAEQIRLALARLFSTKLSRLFTTTYKVGDPSAFLIFP